MIARPLVAASFLATSSFAGVLHVGPLGSVHPFHDIQSAIDAAVPGDTIRVHAGTYTGFVLNKPLAILGDGSNAVQITPTTQPGAAHVFALVQSVTASNVAVLSGMRFEAHGLGYAPGLTSVLIEQNAGVVVLADLLLPQGVGGGRMFCVESSAWCIGQDLVLTAGWNGGANGGAIDLLGSTFWLSQSLVDGGGSGFGGAMGRIGVLAEDSTVYVATTKTSGGFGANLLCYILGGIPFYSGTPGRSGLELRGTSVAKFVGGPQSAAVGGPGGPGSIFTCSPGPQGPALWAKDTSELLYAPAQISISGAVVEDPFASIHAIPVVYPTLTTSSTRVTPGTTLLVQASGNPGGVHALLASPRLAAAPIPLPGIDGAVALDVPQALWLGSKPLDASGATTFGLSVPSLPSFTDTVFYIQSIEFGPQQVALSNPVLVVVQG